MDADTQAILDLLSPVERLRFGLDDSAAAPEPEPGQPQEIPEGDQEHHTEPTEKQSKAHPPISPLADAPLGPAVERAIASQATRRRRRRDSVGQGKHLNPVAGGSTHRLPPGALPGTAPRSGLPSEFSDLTRGVPTNQELVDATAQLLRKFHGRAFMDGGSAGKQAAVAFGVLVDKITLLRSQAAAPIAAEDADQHREKVLRLVGRLTGILGPR